MKVCKFSSMVSTQMYSSRVGSTSLIQRCNFIIDPPMCFEVGKLYTIIAEL